MDSGLGGSEVRPPSSSSPLLLLLLLLLLLPLKLEGELRSRGAVAEDRLAGDMGSCRAGSRLTSHSRPAVMQVTLLSPGASSASGYLSIGASRMGRMSGVSLREICLVKQSTEQNFTHSVIAT